MGESGGEGRNEVLTSSEGGFAATTIHRTPKLSGGKLNHVPTHVLLRALHSSHRSEILHAVFRVGTAGKKKGRGARFPGYLTDVSVGEDQFEPPPRDVRFDGGHRRRNSGRGQFDSRNIETGGRLSSVAGDLGAEAETKEGTFQVMDGGLESSAGECL